jgi:hypothetical protein
MTRNSMLSKKYKSSFGDSQHCSCDCNGQAPALHAKAATMLEQVGEVPQPSSCSCSCSCVPSDSEHDMRQYLGHELW